MLWLRHLRTCVSVLRWAPGPSAWPGVLPSVVTLDMRDRFGFALVAETPRCGRLRMPVMPIGHGTWHLESRRLDPDTDRPIGTWDGGALVRLPGDVDGFWGLPDGCQSQRVARSDVEWRARLVAWSVAPWDLAGVRAAQLSDLLRCQTLDVREAAIRALAAIQVSAVRRPRGVPWVRQPVG
jgi:hypothetical protein